jgi:hypothetical protein
MSTPEGKVKDMVRRGLEKLTALYRFMPVQNGMGAPGLDFYLCAGGWFIAIETKVKGKKPTPRQDQTIANIEAAHGLVFVVDDKESCDRAMDVIGSCCRLANLIRLPKYGEKEKSVLEIQAEAHLQAIREG